MPIPCMQTAGIKHTLVVWRLACVHEYVSMLSQTLTLGRAACTLRCAAECSSRCSGVQHLLCLHRADHIWPPNYSEMDE